MSIARRLAQDGAKVVISSSKQDHVDGAVKTLQSESGKLVVEGIVCNVGSYEHRRNLVEKVKNLKYGSSNFEVLPIPL